MKQFLVYLAGPITGCSFDECVNWREEFIAQLPKEIIGLSPLRGKEYLEGEKSVADHYPNLNNVLSTQKGITTRDYNDVRRSDLIVVNLLGAKKVSIGTVMEIAWAKSHSVPVILVMEEKDNIHDHSMIRESCGFRVATIEEALHLTRCILLPVKHRNEMKTKFSLPELKDIEVYKD